jgi:hypothetical protein
MKYHIVSVGLICAALTLYATGALNRGIDLGVSLTIAGLFCEFLFWRRILRIDIRRRSKSVSR